MFHIYIGPNGFGKTHALEDERDKLKSSGIPESEILFIESELLLQDEVKDNKDTTKTMEFIIGELLTTSKEYLDKKKDFEECVDSIIDDSTEMMNKILESVLSYNGSVRDSKDFISKTKTKEHKKLVSINSKDIKEKMGSGQRMQFILNLVNHYTCKKYIFLDEPEKYSHPTFLHKTAQILNELNKKGIEVYIATHSPKLLSMLDLDLEQINIINDTRHICKKIDFDGALTATKFKTLGSFKERERSYYEKTTLIKNIKSICYKEFLECLFTKKVYIVEGINDRFLLNKILIDNDLFFDEYVVFQSWGKFLAPIFAQIFKSLDIETIVYFDQDDESKSKHSEINSFLSGFKHYMFVPNIETVLGISKIKDDTVAVTESISSLGSLKDTYVAK